MNVTFILYQAAKNSNWFLHDTSPWSTALPRLTASAATRLSHPWANEPLNHICSFTVRALAARKLC
ncbi:hypothetical protein PoMZ_09215 [Pyricularia oryzae]|uniref:Uncharacterized protein n=1 Tax=Pyricularia oryzae TaxID=318829 RepID=A0A4P7MTK5_PYROR|nr:hypothetical protein PoMZ_09215 [Pyricularia oryzae]